MRNIVLASIVGLATSIACASDVNVPNLELTSDAHARQLDNNSIVRINGMMQFRYSYTNDKNTDNHSYGFNVPLARIDFKGNLPENFNFRISPAVNNSGVFSMQDAWVNHTFDVVGANIGVTFGQIRPHFMNELNVDAENLTTISTSILSNTLGQTYTQGIQANANFGPAHVFAGFTDGRNMANSPVNHANNNYGVNAKVEFDVLSNSANGSGTTVGAGIMHEDDFDTYLVDANTHFGNFNFDLAGVYSSTNTNDMYGAVGTASYKVNSNFQPYVSHEYGHVDNNPTMNVSYAGLNYFFGGNKCVRWSNDVGYSWGQLPSSWNYTNTGFNSSSRSGSVVLRSQFQIMF